MDRTWIYRNIHLLISLLLIGTSEISSKKYYCTKAGTWREAMEKCTRSGGVPLLYRDVYNSTEFTLKDNRKVWTADYIYLEYITDIAHGKTTEGYECGYKTFYIPVWFKGKYEYSSRLANQYGRCTATKKYFCYSQSRTYFREGISTWDEAISNCSSHKSFALWSGYSFSWNTYVENIEIWDRRVRRVTKGTVNGTITIDYNNIETCGTNVEEVKRYNSNNCEEYLESVCVFDGTVNDTDTFTRTCFEEETTEVPINVTRRPFGDSTTVTSADNRTSKGHKGQDGDSIGIVVATSVAVCCIFVGIGLFCYCTQRRKTDEKNTTVQYVNENLSSTITGRNPSDTNDSVNDRINAVDIADEYYEACDAPSGINSVDDVYTTKQHGEYGNIYSACREETISGNTHNTAAIPIEESEYDSTRNIKEYEKGSNIYNSLGFEGAESVYDCGQYNKNKGLHVDSSTYSSCSIQDNTNTTTAGLNGSRQNHGLLSSNDNVNSTSPNDTNQHDETYGNIGKVHQTADRSSIYDTAYHNGT